MPKTNFFLIQPGSSASHGRIPIEDGSSVDAVAQDFIMRLNNKLHPLERGLVKVRDGRFGTDESYSKVVLVSGLFWVRAGCAVYVEKQHEQVYWELRRRIGGNRSCLVQGVILYVIGQIIFWGTATEQTRQQAREEPLMAIFTPLCFMVALCMAGAALYGIAETFFTNLIEGFPTYYVNRYKRTEQRVLQMVTDVAGQLRSEMLQRAPVVSQVVNSVREPGRIEQKPPVEQNKQGWDGGDISL